MWMVLAPTSWAGQNHGESCTEWTQNGAWNTESIRQTSATFTATIFMRGQEQGLRGPEELAQGHTAVA